MKQLYTHENKMMVENMRNHLRQAGIEALMKNEFSGGGIGELSPLETWPELWVSNAEYSRAKAVLATLREPILADNWHCNNCDEENEGNFEICWKCQHSAAQS
ncbi:MAG: DUF2007 domain-containing protein [Cellvibrionaceae bacterium]|nr:DUF2007 domain-containing protein [Cellvibrionaceae bacterium]